jgi:hypothetical protein
MSSSSDNESSNSLCRSDLDELMASSVEALLGGACNLLGHACGPVVGVCGWPGGWRGKEGGGSGRLGEVPAAA